MIDDIQELLSREPFQQFNLHTTGDNEYTVYSEKQVTIPMHGESIHFRSRDGVMHILALRHIIKVTHRVVLA